MWTLRYSSDKYQECFFSLRPLVHSAGPASKRSSSWPDIPADRRGFTIFRDLHQPAVHACPCQVSGHPLHLLRHRQGQPHFADPRLAQAGKPILGVKSSMACAPIPAPKAASASITPSTSTSSPRGPVANKPRPVPTHRSASVFKWQLQRPDSFPVAEKNGRVRQPARLSSPSFLNSFCSAASRAAPRVPQYPTPSASNCSSFLSPN